MTRAEALTRAADHLRLSLAFIRGSHRCEGAAKETLLTAAEEQNDLAKEYFCGSGYCDDPACIGEHWQEPETVTSYHYGD